MQRANQAARILWPKLWIRVRREPLDQSQLCPSRFLSANGKRLTTEKGDHYLIQGIRDAVSLLRNIQREHFTRVDNERDHARRDKNGDENRRDRVEARPAVVLYEQRRYDHTHRT